MLAELLSSEGLGDVVCVEGDCAAGEQAVHQLAAFYSAAREPAQFAAAVSAVIHDFQELDAQWQRHLPFSGVCCAIKQVGQQAQDLTAQIAAALRIAPPPGIPTLAPGPSSDLVGLVRTLTAVAAVGGVAWLASQAFEGKP